MYCAKYVKISERELQEHSTVTEASLMLHTLGLFKSLSVCEGNFIWKVKEDTTRGKKNNPEHVLRQDQPKRQSSECLNRDM